MIRVAIIGATGSLGRELRKELENQSNYKVTLFSRRAKQLQLASNETAVSGSATSGKDLDALLAGQDFVFVALSGNLPKMAKEIVASMKRIGNQRLVFVSSMGIYGEVDGEARGVVSAILKPYREAADIVESSGLDYTVLRPGWFDNRIDSICQIIKKGEIFYGHDVSRKSIVTLVKQMIDTPELYIGESLGLYH